MVWASVGEDFFGGLAQDVEAILALLSGKCGLVLVDGCPTCQICRLGELYGLDCIVGTQNLQHGISRWRHNSYSLRHCNVGGVITTPLPGCASCTGTSCPYGKLFPLLLGGMPAQCSVCKHPATTIRLPLAKPY
jgi:hypothetical protein